MRVSSLGYPNAHPAFKVGVRENVEKLPEYINITEMLIDLNAPIIATQES